MGPLATQAAISIGGSLAGAGINKLFGGSPDVPDISSMVRDNYARERGRLDEQFNRRKAQIEGDLAAQGITGTGGVSMMDQLFRASGGAQADLAAQGARDVQQAEQRERMMQFQQDQGKAQNRAQSISNILQGAGEAYLGSKYGVGAEDVAGYEAEGGDGFTQNPLTQIGADLGSNLGGTNDFGGYTMPTEAMTGTQEPSAYQGMTLPGANDGKAMDATSFDMESVVNPMNSFAFAN